MSFRALLVLCVVLLTLATGCTTTAPPATPPPPVTTPEDTSPEPVAPRPTVPDSTTTEEPRRMPEPPPTSTVQNEPALGETDSTALPDPLYEQTEEALRLAFTDGLFGLYRAEVDPADARRLDQDEITSWLTDLALVSPRAVEFAHAQLGPVLEQAYVVGLLLEDAAEAECASMRDVLYVPVPARFQGPDRPFTGYIVQDACGVTSGDLARYCTGGFGTTADGAACSCVCTTGEAPSVPCVSC